MVLLSEGKCTLAWRLEGNIFVGVVGRGVGVWDFEKELQIAEYQDFLHQKETKVYDSFQSQDVNKTCTAMSAEDFDQSASIEQERKIYCGQN